MSQIEDKNKSRRMTLTFIVLASIAAFMYVSIMYKIVKFGP
jgi:hypothetical protein